MVFTLNPCRTKEYLATARRHRPPSQPIAAGLAGPAPAGGHGVHDAPLRIHRFATPRGPCPVPPGDGPRPPARPSRARPGAQAPSPLVRPAVLERWSFLSRL